MRERRQDDLALAARYGAYAGFRTEAAPIRVEYAGGNPAEDVTRLVDQHARAEGRFPDIGCGAGQTLCRLAPLVQEAWGFDMDRDLMGAARRRVSELGIENVTCVEGNVAEAADVAQLPDNHFDLALSQRGPNLNASLARKLRDDAIFIQELVSEFDFFPLMEGLGLRPVASYSPGGHEWLVRQYVDLGLFPVGTREYFYEEYFRNGDHLAAFLDELGPARWSLRAASSQDRRAFETYVREQTTPSGVRLLRHRRVFVLRRTRPTSYPRVSA